MGDNFAEMGGEKDDVVAKENVAGDVVEDTKENQAGVNVIEEKKDGTSDKKSSEFPPISYFSLYRCVFAILCCITIQPRRDGCVVFVCFCHYERTVYHFKK